MFDVVAIIVLLPLTLLVGAVVAVAIFIDSPGPVFYRSPRVGRGGQRFDMLKFRSMRHGAAGPSISHSGDARRTPIGHFLSVSRLDELPQLWHVLRGEMRLVGPRPELELFVIEQGDAYERILSVPPGLTGPTQLAFAGERWLLPEPDECDERYRSELLPKKVRMDLQYVERNSLAGDVKILLYTCLLPARRLAVPGILSLRSRRALASAAIASLALSLLLVVFVANNGAAL